MTEQLEKEAQRCFEAEELAARYKDELETLRNHRSDEVLGRLGQLEEAVRTKDTEIGSLKVKTRNLTVTRTGHSPSFRLVSLSFIYAVTH